jgi:hypothetical protein
MKLSDLVRKIAYDKDKEIEMIKRVGVTAGIGVTFVLTSGIVNHYKLETASDFFDYLGIGGVALLFGSWVYGCMKDKEIERK